jgi:hypothetical protein
MAVEARPAGRQLQCLSHRYETHSEMLQFLEGRQQIRYRPAGPSGSAAYPARCRSPVGERLPVSSRGPLAAPRQSLPPVLAKRPSSRAGRRTPALLSFASPASARQTFGESRLTLRTAVANVSTTLFLSIPRMRSYTPPGIRRLVRRKTRGSRVCGVTHGVHRGFFRSEG